MTAPGPSTTDDTDASPETPDTDGGDSPTDTPDTDPTLPATSAYFPYVHRLSHTEYAQSVADLFPGVALPVPTFVDDPAPFGFDNDAPSLRASRGEIQRHQKVAEQVSYAVVQRADALFSCSLRRDPGCIDAVVEDLGGRAFRRPLTADERAMLRSLFDEEPGLSDPDAGLRLLVELLLQSPPFLYRIERPAAPADADGWAPIDAWALASRLSTFLWSTLPDDALRAAADDGSLLTDEGFAEQVDRMIASPRIQAGAFHFWSQWAELERMRGQAKPVTSGWSPQVIDALREQASRFVAQTYADDGTLDDLLTGTRVEVDAHIAAYYGVPAPPVGTWTGVDLDPDQRSGLLTLSAFLAGHAHTDNASPVLRGVFVLRKLYCSSIGSPPAVGAAMVTPAPVPGHTNREMYTALTAAPLCTSCHARINPAGFLFEHYDALGAWQDQDVGRAVDASGGVDGAPYADAVDFLHQASTDDAVAKCLVRQWLKYAWGGEAADRASMETDVHAAWRTDARLSTLLREVVMHPRFRAVPVDQDGAP